LGKQLATDTFLLLAALQAQTNVGQLHLCNAFKTLVN